MKKRISLFLLIILSLCLTACSGSDTSNKNKIYSLGDTVSTDIFEFTLNSAQFTVALGDRYGIQYDTYPYYLYFSPKEYNAQEDASNSYVAPVGHTYAAFSYTVNNLNRTSSDFHKGSFASVKYDGKEYDTMKDGAYFPYQDKKIMDVNNTLKTEEAGKWYSSPASNFQLMAGEKETRRAYIDIPIEIKDLTEDVEITVSIPTSTGESEKFTYIVTEENRKEHAGKEIDMSLDLAINSFTTLYSRDYFADHLDEYPAISGEEISTMISAKREWKVDYYAYNKGNFVGTWSGTFFFESDGRIRDDYGFVNERTWSVNGNNLILDGEFTCGMRKVKDGVYLLLLDNGTPYMLMQ